MKNKLFPSSAWSFYLCGCNNNKDNDNVVSQRYIHKYGYAVSQEEWESKKLSRTSHHQP